MFLGNCKLYNIAMWRTARKANETDIVRAYLLIRSWPTSIFSYSSIFIQIESRALAKRTNYCNNYILSVTSMWFQT